MKQINGVKLSDDFFLHSLILYFIFLLFFDI